jgi:predicted RNase H-like HicB family nuclease
MTKIIDRRVFPIRGDPMFRYAIEIFFSEEDEGYMAVVPELRGCSAFGETQSEALNEVLDAIETWISNAKDMGWEIPEPSMKNLLKVDLLQDQIGKEINA